MASRGIVWMVLFLFVGASPCWSQEIDGAEGPLSLPKLTFVSYEFQSLLVDQDHSTPDLAPLIVLIQRFVSPESWETAGGTGRIFGIGSSLLVYQDSHAHLEISRFLQVLKFAQAKSAMYGGENVGTRFGDFAVEAFPYFEGDRSVPFALVYPLRDLPRQATFVTDRDGLTGAPRKRSLVDLLKTVPPADSWIEHGGAGSVIDLPVANCVIIVQTDPVHQQLVEFLGALRTNRDGLDLFDPHDSRIVEYALFDRDGVVLRESQMREVAMRLQAELRTLGWQTEDRFIVVDRELAISQTTPGHAAVSQKLAEWGLKPLTISHRNPTDTGLQPRDIPNPPWIRQGPTDAPRSAPGLRFIPDPLDKSPFDPAGQRD